MNKTHFKYFNGIQDVRTGYIHSIEDGVAYFLLKKDYSLDMEGEFNVDQLSPHHQEIISQGSIIRYNLDNGKIEFLKNDGTWF